MAYFPCPKVLCALGQLEIPALTFALYDGISRLYRHTRYKVARASPIGSEGGTSEAVAASLGRSSGLLSFESLLGGFLLLGQPRVVAAAVAAAASTAFAATSVGGCVTRQLRVADVIFRPSFRMRDDRRLAQISVLEVGQMARFGGKTLPRTPLVAFLVPQP